MLDGVSISLYEHQTPLVSVVLGVLKGELFVAVIGQGAYCNNQPQELMLKDTQGIRRTVSAPIPAWLADSIQQNMPIIP